MSNPGGKAGEDGKFRVCGLIPGDYTLTAIQFEGLFGVQFYGKTPVSISDKDLHGLRIVGLPLFNLAGEVAFEGAPAGQTSGQTSDQASGQPGDRNLILNLQPMMRPMMGENARATITVPGTFTMEKLPASDYLIRFGALPSGSYIRNIIYNGNSILNLPLPVGTGAAAPSLRISLGTDGGFISANVTDSNGSPVRDAFIHVMPAIATSEAMLAAAMISGAVDQKGAWKSPALAPGKYYVLATSEAVDKSPESIGRLWQRRTSAKEVDLGAAATAALTLTVVSLE